MGKLKKNLVYNISYQILILFLPLVTSFYLARIVGADGIGRYTFSYSVALYFTYFTVLGLQKYGNRTIASVQQDKKARSIYFWEIYTMQAICFAICIFLYCLYACFIAKDKNIALIQSLFVLSSLFDINWFFFGMEMFDKTVLRNTIVKLSTTALIFIFIRQPGDVEKYAFIMAAGYLCSQLALWPYLKTLIVFERVHLNDVKKHVLPNLKLFLPVIAVSIYKIMDKIMLGAMTTASSVGFYENAEKIINVPVAIVSALGTVMLPRVTALVSEKKDMEVSYFRDKATTIVAAFTVAACFGIIGVADNLSVCMWGEDFIASGAVMKYLSVTLVFLGIGNVMRTQFLIPYKYDKVYVLSAFIGAIVNVVVNALLIPRFSEIGAAIGTIFAEVTVCFYQLYKVREKLPLKTYAKEVILFSVAGVAMLVIIHMLPPMNSKLYSLLISIIIGALFYILVTAPYLYRHLIKDRKKENVG